MEDTKMSDSFIKLSRKITDWEWYKDANTCRLFIHMLLKANWKAGRFKGTEVPAGSFVSSYRVLAEETGLTIDEVRTAIKHLKLTKELTTQNKSKYTLFSVQNWHLYQDVPTLLPKQVPSKSQASPKHFPTIEEIKKRRREERKNIYKAKKSFNNFDEHDYDFEALEKDLLKWGDS